MIEFIFSRNPADRNLYEKLLDDTDKSGYRFLKIVFFETTNLINSSYGVKN